MAGNNDSHNFVLTLESVVDPGGDLEDALFESGCDDATLTVRNRVAYLEFDRQAPSLDAAIRSAIRDVKRANPRLSIVAAETGDTR